MAEVSKIEVLLTFVAKLGGKEMVFVGAKDILEFSLISFPSTRRARKACLRIEWF